MNIHGATVWWDACSMLATTSRTAGYKGPSGRRQREPVKGAVSRAESGGENWFAVPQRRCVVLKSPKTGCSCPKGSIYFTLGSVGYPVQPPDCAPEVTQKSCVICADVSEMLLGFKWH